MFLLFKSEPEPFGRNLLQCRDRAERDRSVARVAVSPALLHTLYVIVRVHTT